MDFIIKNCNKLSKIIIDCENLLKTVKIHKRKSLLYDNPFKIFDYVYYVGEGNIS